MKSAVAGIVWPALPAPRDAGFLALLFQLERSQWFSPEKLWTLQSEQLSCLLAHAAATVPYYQRAFQSCGYIPRLGQPVDMGDFRRLPLLTRSAVQQVPEQLQSRQLPPGHGRLMQCQTSGSTGMPVVCYSSGLSQLLWKAIAERDDLWHRRNDFVRLAVIRYLSGMKPGEERCMDAEAVKKFRLLGGGEVHLMSIQTDVATQAAWLRTLQPDSLLSYPSNVAALARHCRDVGWQLPALREIRTFGETLDDEVRGLCREVWGATVKDTYSAQEIGALALQCPDHACYHVQAETVLLEVLDDHGVPCRPGEVGRVVATVLHNFAMPLIRYELGDFAEVGATCACGRGLPVLRRVMGRQRNILTAPDGRRYWPSFPANLWHGLVPVRQVRIIQQTLHKLKVDFVADRQLSPAEREQFAAALQQNLPCRFEVELERVEVIGRSAGGKFEDFVSRIV